MRDATPRVLSALARRFPEQFDLCEDAVQDVLLRAHRQGMGIAPEDPGAWLFVAARNRLIDLIRSEAARRGREQAWAESSAKLPIAVDDEDAPDSDDSLFLFFLCCHPVLTEGSQVALTLRCVGGLATEAIAAAFLVPESTMAQRISRAKQRLRESGARFGPLNVSERLSRMTAVTSCLYAIFTEGHIVTRGAVLYRADLCKEAIRLTRLLSELAPYSAETTALLALLLLTDARRGARATDSGELVPFDEQDRGRWDHDEIAEGRLLLRDALVRAPVSGYALQAAIAAVHSEAPSVDKTDWPQILALYVLLEKVAPSPMVTLNRIVAVAMVEGPAAALIRLETHSVLPALAGHPRVAAVRAHLLERAGRDTEAVAAYRSAARGSLSLPEQRYLQARAAALDRAGTARHVAGTT